MHTQIPSNSPLIVYLIDQQQPNEILHLLLVLYIYIFIYIYIYNLLTLIISYSQNIVRKEWQLMVSPKQKRSDQN